MRASSAGATAAAAPYVPGASGPPPAVIAALDGDRLEDQHLVFCNTTLTIALNFTSPFTRARPHLHYLACEAVRPEAGTHGCAAAILKHVTHAEPT